MNKLHIGSLIKAEMKRQDMSVSELAKLLNVHRQTVYDMLKHTNIDVERLKDVSEVLHKDFLQVISQTQTTVSPDWCEVIVTENTGDQTFKSLIGSVGEIGSPNVY